MINSTMEDAGSSLASLSASPVAWSFLNFVPSFDTVAAFVVLFAVALLLMVLHQHRAIFTIQRPRDGSQMWGFVGIPQAQQWTVSAASGQCSSVIGPKVVFVMGATLDRLRAVQASDTEYLRVDFVDGRSEIMSGPCVINVDPLIHKNVKAHPAIQLSEHEVLVVYRQEDSNASKAQSKDVKRSLIYGPCLHVPQNASEWVHEFSWHGAHPTRDGIDLAKKTKNALKFKKLRVCPDQTYYDVEDVRTKDDALLTIKLMIFFRLESQNGIQTMLEETHDPIADFINAVSSDVIEYVSGKSFEEFKASTEQMNDLGIYRQLTSRAKGIGFDVTKVVFRGYGAPNRLQKMHDDAIERRTKLSLDRETEEQEQQLKDKRLQREEQRQRQEHRMEQEKQVHEMEMQKAAHDQTQKEQLAERHASFEHLARLKQDLGMSGDSLAEYIISLERGPPEKLIQIMSNKDSNGVSTPPFVQIQAAQ
jgi:regulator of protease activity HflC (stomatin/prohibitin superfamily)